MALGAALVDRARIVRNESLAVKVEGSTRFVRVPQPWFKARLELPRAPEGVDPGGGRRRAVRVPTLMAALKDEDGNLLALRHEDEVEFVSRTLFGDDEPRLYRLTVDAAPIRKKRRVIGWEASVARIEPRAVAEVA
jgi:hypothetical protein